MKYVTFIYYLCLSISLCQSQLVLPNLDQPSNAIPPPPLPPSNLTAPTPRKVSIATEFHLQRKAISRKSGLPVYGGHARILIAGTSTEGPFTTELDINPIIDFDKPDRNRLWAIRTKDMG
ncbi:MAG: hypothetical protein Q9169_008175, partial [Polycauliona sp. 2 TL-2023]